MPIKGLRIGDAKNTAATNHPKWESMVADIDEAFVMSDDERQLATHILIAHLLGHENRKQELRASKLATEGFLLRLDTLLFDEYAVDLKSIASPPTQPNP